MSYCKEIGKDKIIFLTREDHGQPSTVTLSADKETRGLIDESGNINWSCPCLGGMASGPCGFQFREAFSCFHHSKEDAKGADCIEKFTTMHDCMSKYPNVYPQKDDEVTDDAVAFEDIETEAEKLTTESSSQGTQSVEVAKTTAELNIKS